MKARPFGWFVTLPTLFLMPALVSFLPTELIGLDSAFLQRFPSADGRGAPIFDVLIVVSALLLISPFVRYKAHIVDAAIWGIVFYALWCFLFRNNAGFSQSVGLLLTFGSVTVFLLVRSSRLTEEGLEQVLHVFRWMTIASVLLALGLMLYSAMGGGPGGLIMTQDRFLGEDMRFRWRTPRNSEKLVVAAAVAWAVGYFRMTYHIGYLSVPLVMFVTQIMQSSRGGVLLVLVSSLIGFQYVPATMARRRLSRQGRMFVGALTVFTFFTLLIIAVAVSDSLQTLLWHTKELVASDSIRQKMADSAFALATKSIIFGGGFFDLYSTTEWSGFERDNMFLPIHNIFLQYIVYLGVLGVFLISLVYLYLMYHFSVLWIKRRELEATRVIYQSVATAVFFAALYMALFQSMDRITLMYFWAIMGGSVALARIERTAPQNSRGFE